MLVGKRQAGTVDKYVWATDDAVIEVPTALAVDLIRIGHADFYEAKPVRSVVPVTPEEPTPQPSPIEALSPTSDMRGALEAATTPPRGRRPAAKE